MKPEKYFKDGEIRVREETFAVVKAKKPLPDAFAVIKDGNEITIIINQSRVSTEDVIEIERGWKILTFDMVLPFGLVGFMSKVSSALADENISIFTVSAYSTDHILVKEKDLSRAVKKLESLGCIIE